MKTVIISLFFLISLFEINQNVKDKTVKLEVEFSNLKHEKGVLYWAIYDNKNSFLQQKAYKRGQVIKPPSDYKIKIDTLQTGIYAIICFQDLNDNKKLDFDQYIPSEPWGLSNNVSLMGPPTWKDAVFTIQKDTLIEIKLF